VRTLADGDGDAGTTKAVRKTSPFCKKGSWVEGANESQNIHYAGVKKPLPEFESEEDLHRRACPVETFMHNCFFHNITARAEKLIRRRWVFEDNRCKDFSAYGFLKAISNRKIYFAGDSLMHLIWNQLICHLYTTVKIDTEVNWVLYKGGTDDVKHHIYNNVTCPFGRKEHCHYLPGLNSMSATIESINSSLYFGWFDGYTRGYLGNICQHFNLGPNDIIIMNFGVHYNNVGRLIKSHYEDHLKMFVSDAKTISTPLYFMESLPQHFSRSNGDTQNGYFFDPEATKSCAPIGNGSIDVAASRDWRNRLAEQYLNDVVPIIEVASALYSQYDAHVDGDSPLVDFDRADCTHYCAPSGVFHYIFAVIYNTFLEAG